jgi:hypothetical protein
MNVQTTLFTELPTGFVDNFSKIKPHIDSQTPPPSDESSFQCLRVVHLTIHNVDTPYRLFFIRTGFTRIAKYIKFGIII